MRLLPRSERPTGRGYRERSRFRVRRQARVRYLLGPDSTGIRQSLVALSFSSLTAVVAGGLLAAMTGTLERYPGLLVLVPAAIGMRGNIFGALGSRLATSIHAGTFRMSRRPEALVMQNVIASGVLSLVTAVALAVLTKILSPIFGLDSVIAISDGVFQWKGTNKRTAIGAMVNSGFITFATSTLSGSYAADIAEESWTSSDGTTTLYADFDEVKSGFTTFWASSNDADGDGLADGVETNTGTFVDASNTGTDPNDPDTDDDGLEDGVETNTGTFVSASDTGTDPHVADTDSDGLADGVETNTGAYVSASDTGTDPHLADTDGDTISDGVETGLDPNTDSAAAISLLPSTGGGVEQSVHDAVVTELANAREARAGSTVIDVANNLADITLRVEQTSDVSDWSNATTSDHTIQLSAPAGASFYRFTIPE